MEKLTTIVEQPFKSKTDLDKEYSVSSYNAPPHPTPPYLKKINNASDMQTEMIIYFVERELKWLDSDEYILRKQKVTGMLESTIEKDTQKIKT